MRRRPGPPTPTIACTLAVVALLTGAGCSGDRSPDHARRPAPPPAVATVDLEPGPVKVAAVKPGTPLPPGTAEGVMDAVETYLVEAVARPLSRGKAGDLGPVFSDPARSRLDGPDRAVVLDEALPAPIRTPRLTAQPVGLTVLVDAGGRPVLASAALSVEVDARARTGAYTVRRLGELTLAPGGNGWRITGYDLTVVRDGAGLARTSRGPSGSATTAARPSGEARR